MPTLRPILNAIFLSKISFFEVGIYRFKKISILLEYGLPYEFPKEIEEEASQLPIEITADEISKRRDMRNDFGNLNWNLREIHSVTW